MNLHSAYPVANVLWDYTYLQLNSKDADFLSPSAKRVLELDSALREVGTPCKFFKACTSLKEIMSMCKPKSTLSLENFNYSLSWYVHLTRLQYTCITINYHYITMYRYVDNLNIRSLICYINYVCNFFKLGSFPIGLPDVCLSVHRCFYTYAFIQI